MISGTGFAVPERRVTNDELALTMETTDAWIVERTGIRERRVAGPADTTAALAVGAGRAALARAGRDAADINVVIVATCTPDQLMPSTAALVARELGMTAGTMDLNAACAGFVYALVTACALATAAGAPVLVVGADTMSTIVDFGDRSTGMLFGDGAGAVVIEPQPRDVAAQGDVPLDGLLAWDFGSDGSAAALLEAPLGGTLRMDGPEVFRLAVRSAARSATTVLDAAGVPPSSVKLFVPHQANARIVDAMLPRVGLASEQTFVNIDRYGNTSAASIPIALAEADAAGRVGPGDLVLMTGFGAGMTWASALVRWGCPAREHAVVDAFPPIL